MGSVLTVVLPCVIIGYGVFLAVRMIRGKSRGCGSCTGCPYASSCGEIGKVVEKRSSRHDS